MIKKAEEICVFCTKPEVKDREIVGNKLAWAFPTNIPIVPGHILVVPRRCVATYKDLTEKEKVAIEKIRIIITEALKKTFKAEGFNYAWNENTVAGQAVPHFHLHIVPRKNGDTGILEYDPRKFLYRPGSRETTPEKELEKVCEMIKKYI